MDLNFKEYSTRKHPVQELDSSFLEKVAAEVLSQASLTPKHALIKIICFLTLPLE